MIKVDQTIIDQVILDQMSLEINPESLSVYKGCDREPYDLARHLIVVYLIGVCFSEMDSLRYKYVNALEEIAFDASGPPSCWKLSDQNFFLTAKHYVGVG